MNKIPNDFEIEECVLGSIIQDKEAVWKINLKPSDFYNIKNQKIFQAMCLLRDKKEPIDIVSLGSELGSTLKGIGGHTKLMTLSNRIPTASNIKYHAKKVKEFSYKRDLMNKAYQLIQGIENNRNIEKYKRNLIDTGISDLKVETIKSLAGKFSDYYFKEEELGIMTGIPKIDKITNGSGAGEIVTFTADSGQGKSNMLMNIAIHNLKLGKKVMYINIEMDTNDVLTRMIAMYNDLDASGIRAKREDSQRVMAGLGEMENSNFKLITEGKIKSEEIIQQAYIEKMKDGLDILIVDYLNEIKDDKDEKLNLNIATGNLKDGALRLEVPVFTAYQMDKFARREDSTPKKEDARGSTVVADRASMMFSIVNESMRSKEYDPFTKDDDEMSIYVLKNRNGPKNFKCKEIYLNKKSLMFYEGVDNYSC